MLLALALGEAQELGSVAAEDMACRIGPRLRQRRRHLSQDRRRPISVRELKMMTWSYYGMLHFLYTKAGSQAQHQALADDPEGSQRLVF
jgi:hypothetical protein